MVQIANRKAGIETTELGVDLTDMSPATPLFNEIQTQPDTLTEGGSLTSQEISPRVVKSIQARGMVRGMLR